MGQPQTSLLLSGSKQGWALPPLPFQRSKRIVGTFGSYAQSRQGRAAPGPGTT